MKKFGILAVLFSCFLTHAQEFTLPAQTQYLADNPFIISHAYAGIGDNARIRLNGLAQWIGIKDAPINQSLAADFRISNRSGVGAYLYNDKNGNTRQYGAKVSFAHHLVLDLETEQYFSFGLSFNLNHFRIDIENFQYNNGNVENDRYNQNYNFDVSALYRRKDFFLSYNASNILKKDFREMDVNEPSLLFNHQIFLGSKIRKRGSDFEMEPSMFVQYLQGDGRSTTDLNIKFKRHFYEDYVWIGGTMRFINEQVFNPVTVGPVVGARVNNFYFGYSYQVNTNELAAYNSGTHMITIGLDFLQSLSNCPCTHTRIIY